MKIELADEEVVLLDGKVTPETQAIVNQSKERLAMVARFNGIPPEHAKFIADVVAEAHKNGEIVFHHTNLCYCVVCKASAGYAEHKRSSRYHRVGTANTDRPLTMPGKEFARRFISMQGYAAIGCCNKCFELIEKPLKEALASVVAELPESFMGCPPKFKRYDKRQCKCGWQGHEGEMGRLRCLFDSGTYPGKCPKCGAENSFFVSNIEKIDGFVIIPNSQTHE